MLIGIFTSNYKEEFEVDIMNLCQLKDYLIHNKKHIWDEIKNKELSYAVLNIQEDNLDKQILYPNMLTADISSYNSLIIVEKIEGEALFTALSTILVASVLGVSTATAATLAITAFVATFLTSILVIGIVYGIGQLIQMLMPTQKLDRDPSVNQKNLLFNGIPNTKEQGGSVPLIFGECYFGGVQIGVKLSTVDYIVGRDIVYDELPRYTSVNGTRMEKTGTNYVNTGNPYIQATWARVY